VLGGRAFWKEFFTYSSPAERQKFAETDCVKRVQEVDAIVKTGTPWFKRYGYSLEDLHAMRATEGWHARYGGGTAGGAAVVDKDAVY
jgi:tagatose 1,6-diphosphate aldolase